jgi:hypothetical protein
LFSMVFGSGVSKDILAQWSNQGIRYWIMWWLPYCKWFYMFSYDTFWWVIIVDFSNLFHVQQLKWWKSGLIGSV